MEAVNLTTKTAALAGAVSPAIVQRVARAALAYPEMSRALERGQPERFSLDTLRRCPPESLAGVLHRLVSDEGFELEPLDRDKLGLEKLPRPLDYLNARI